MRPFRPGALLALTCLATSCHAKDTNVTNQIEQFDTSYQKALVAARQLKTIQMKPCTLGEWGDYRYRTCFRDLSGSAAATMQQLHQILTAAGFKSSSSDSMGSELDNSYSLPGTPFTLNATFGSSGIQWMAFQKGRGTVQPRPGVDASKAKYALMSPIQFAEVQAMRFLQSSVPDEAPERKFTTFSKACGQTPEAASYCLQPLTLDDIYQALSGLYVSGDRGEFDRLNKKATFKDANSKDVQEMVNQGILKPGFVNAFTFYKVAQNHYYVVDTFDHPGHRLDYFIEKQSGGKYQVKITVTRIRIP